MTTMENFIIIVSFLLIGMILRRIKSFPSDTGNVLNAFAIYLAIPAVVLLKIPTLHFSTELWVPAIMPWLMIALTCALVLAFSRLFKWNRSITGALMMVLPLGNTSFLGLPMVKAFFGDQAVPYLLIYDQIGTFLGLATFGTFILAYYGSHGGKPTVKSIGLKVVTFPPFIALLLALALRHITYPGAITRLLEMLAATIVPTVMVAVGFQLKLRLKRSLLSPLSLGLAIKMLLCPLAAILACQLLRLDGEIVKVSIFESAMPPMISAGALAIMAKLEPDLSAALVGFGLLLSFGTLPLLFHLL